MIISTRGRYALRVMIDLSQQDPDSYTPLKEIAARQEISEKYLENILKSLVTQGFILGLRGKGGGYRLTKSPEEYTLASILHATEGTYLVWMDFRALGLSDKELKELIEDKAEVWLDGGAIFGDPGSGFERINVACQRATLVEALDRIEKAVKNK